MTNIKILSVFVGSDKQVAAGIRGVTNLAIEDDSGNLIAYLNGCMIRNNNSTKEAFLAMPSYKAGTDSEGKDRYQSHFKLFPLGKDDSFNQSQKDRMNSLRDEVVKILKAGGTKAPEMAASTPASDASDGW